MSSYLPKRRLLKFSLYSTAVVLPKKILAELGWKPGDEVSITSNQKDKQLVIRRTSNTTPIASPPSQTTPPSRDPQPSKTIKNISERIHDEILPIPEID
ncbi:MAG: AbrB/MazE/SpoVT family DNA-binding domain-containing protein [Patescibacteria group bacterium]